MGIQVVYPRVALPGARLSPHYDLTTEVQPDLIRSLPDVPVIKQSAAAPVQVPAVTMATPNDSRASEARTDRQAQATILSNPEDAHSHDLRFSLRYYRINAQLSVVNELPHLQSATDSDAAISLLRNILQALNTDCSACDFSSDSFDWPLVAGLPMDTEPTRAAHQALGGYLAMRKKQDGFQNLLVFAGKIDELLVRDTKKGEERDYLVRDAAYHLTVTSSLQAMLSYPLLKKEVWQQLQALRERLKNVAVQAGA